MSITEAIRSTLGSSHHLDLGTARGAKEAREGPRVVRREEPKAVEREEQRVAGKEEWMVQQETPLSFAFTGLAIKVTCWGFEIICSPTLFTE